jgi:hypothetical protein
VTYLDSYFFNFAKGEKTIQNTSRIFQSSQVESQTLFIAVGFVVVAASQGRLAKPEMRVKKDHEENYD